MKEQRSVLRIATALSVTAAVGCALVACSSRVPSSQPVGITSVGTPTSSFVTPKTAGTRVTTSATTSTTLSPAITGGTAVPWSPGSRSTLVGDNGNPADWPAAQSKPPSLAGAYSDNMMKVVVTLLTYQDWVGSHPDPALVPNYFVKGTQPYRAEVSLMRELLVRGWHINPSPTEIDWLAVTSQPAPLLIDGKHTMRNGRALFGVGSVTIVIDRKRSAYLDGQGNVVGYSVGGGKTALGLVLAQGGDARWRIAAVSHLSPAGGLGALRR